MTGGSTRVGSLAGRAVDGICGECRCEIEHGQMAGMGAAERTLRCRRPCRVTRVRTAIGAAAKELAARYCEEDTLVVYAHRRGRLLVVTDGLLVSDLWTDVFEAVRTRRRFSRWCVRCVRSLRPQRTSSDSCLTALTSAGVGG